MRPMHVLDVRCWLLFGLVAAVCAGCAPARYPKRDVGMVTGTITYKGEPLTMGTVMFQPESGAFAAGEIQPDGTYSLEGVVGPNSVWISSMDPEDDTPLEELTKPREPRKSHIPQVYSGPGSPLTFDVEAGENIADFDLKDPK